MIVQELKGKIHIGILTVRLDEYDAMESQFKKTEPITGGNNAYELTRVKTINSEDLNVILTRIPKQGNLDAQAVAHNLIDDLDPDWIFLVGIAGGVPDFEYSLGDVLIASHLRDFSVSVALEGGKREYQVDGGPVHPKVYAFLQTKIGGNNRKQLQKLAGFNNKKFHNHPDLFRKDKKDDYDCYFYGDKDWTDKTKDTIHRRFPEGKRNGCPNIWAGSCVNANILVKDTQVLESWKEYAHDVTHVEMELAGVYKAASLAGRKDYPVLAIRGLSDIVGYIRDPNWTEYACNTAAAVAHAIIRTGFIEFEKRVEIFVTDKQIFPARLSHGADKFLPHQQKYVFTTKNDQATVIGIEFMTDGPLGEFDQSRWEAALRELLGKDVSKVRIASIKKGSTTVRILGDPKVVARVIKKLQASPHISRHFQICTGSRSFSRVYSSKTTEQIFGRSEELKHLDLVWLNPRVNVLSIVGFGGVGKSYLIAHWMTRLAVNDWRGAKRVFDWSFYSQSTRGQAASADTFIYAALRFFGEAALDHNNESPWDKGSRLAKLIAQRRTLLVLDGIESLQHPPGPLSGQLKDPALAALLRGLAQHNPGLCIVTTRAHVKDLESFQHSGTVQELELDHLSEEAGAALLKNLLEPEKPNGIYQVKSTENERREISREIRGHALTLHLLGGFIYKALKDIRRWREVKFDKVDASTPGGHAFKTMAAYEKWLAEGGKEGKRELAVLQLLGLFDRPASAGCLAALRYEPIIPNLTEPLVNLGKEDWNIILSSLADCGLVSSSKGERGMGEGVNLDTHPLIRAYFGKQVREKKPEAWRMAHRRLYEYLRDNTPQFPDTLEGLQPLYQAVAHGCQAGLEQEACDKVYRDRILRGNEYYSTRKLGAFSADLGVVAYFFEQPWSYPAIATTKANQSWLLNQTAFYLRALGRLTEALEPMRAALQMGVKQEDWKAAAIRASNLSELELTLGEVAGAVGDAEQSVAYADRSGDVFQQYSKRTTLADALHQAGRRANTLTRFQEAEEMQAKFQPKYQLLYSLQGFRYCDLLLAAPERAAWLTILSLSPFQGEGRGEGVKTCNEVEQRATQTLKWVAGKLGPLNLALDHLTLGRVTLYRAILKKSEIQNSKYEIEQAIAGLHRAGTMDHLPRGLLTRAWLRFLEGDKDGAKQDLDEAWQIAERGPMRLHMADIHLYRARLFHDKEELKKARAMIEQCGYWRRKEELEDAEEAAKDW
jgi:nucleoside phosphorylase/tetratricopeptide (TPR) repeat protein